MSFLSKIKASTEEYQVFSIVDSSLFQKRDELGWREWGPYLKYKGREELDPEQIAPGSILSGCKLEELEDGVYLARIGKSPEILLVRDGIKGPH